MKQSIVRYSILYMLIITMLLSCKDIINNKPTSLPCYGIVDSSLILRDKETICKSVLKNIEYFRLNPQETDPANYYKPYSYIRTQVSPIPADDYLTVNVDLILYNKDASQCFVFISVKQDYSVIPGIVDTNIYYNEMAAIGNRKDTSESFRIYPEKKWYAIYWSNRQDAFQCLLANYSKWLKNDGIAGSIYGNRNFKYNLGDSLFFENMWFEKYDDTTYNFQMYRFLGKDYHYDYPY